MRSKGNCPRGPCQAEKKSPLQPHTLIWYMVSASARLRLAISSYWALTSAMMPSRSRERLLSMDKTTDMSEIWDCSSANSYRDRTEHQDLEHDPSLFPHPTWDPLHTKGRKREKRSEWA